MTTMRTRASKGSELTHGELDANFVRDVDIKATTYAVLVSDNRTTLECNHATVAFTVTLGDAATMAAAEDGEFEVTLTNIGAAIVTVARAGSDTINGASTSLSLNQWDSVTLKVNAATDGYNIVHRGLGKLTASVDELNIMDAGATVTTPTVAGGDAFVMDDSDVGMVQVDIDNVDTYLAATTKTLTNKTLTTPTINTPTIASAVLNTAVSGTAFLDEDDMTSDSATKLASQQSIKAYVDNTILTNGTFTPTIQDNSASDSESQTYSVQSGNYIKLGDFVFFHGRLVVTSIGSLATNESVRIAGLPFTCGALAGSVNIGYGTGMNIGTAGHAAAGGGVTASNTYFTISLWEATAGCDFMTISEASASLSIIFNGMYKV